MLAVGDTDPAVADISGFCLGSVCGFGVPGQLAGWGAGSAFCGCGASGSSAAALTDGCTSAISSEETTLVTEISSAELGACATPRGLAPKRNAAITKSPEKKKVQQRRIACILPLGGAG